LFDKAELVKCINKLVEIDQEWVPYSTDASLYIRPTFIGTEVRNLKYSNIHSPDTLLGTTVNRPITWQYLNAFKHVDMVETIC